MERQYRNHLSGYLHWDQLVHAEDWLLFEKNIGAYICIDEVALSRGELYTVLINKEAHGGKGSMIAIIKGTDVHTVTSVLLKQDRSDRMNVRTFNDSNHTTFTTVSFFIDQYSIEFSTREGYLINTDISTDILFE